MRVSKEFTRAWHAWLHAPSPYSSAYLLRKEITTGKVEHDLDHLESYLYSIGLAAIEGREYEYAEIAARDLAELSKINAELEGYDVVEGEKELFRSHIRVVRVLLEELGKLGSGNGAIQQTIP
ncbi:MAG: hypothetical protein M3458_03125 [Acidobacteriota bacterium]|nr:hypothetical protein [Acidobacteriota bacterium]